MQSKTAWNDNLEGISCNPYTSQDEPRAFHNACKLGEVRTYNLTHNLGTSEIHYDHNLHTLEEIIDPALSRQIASMNVRRTKLVFCVYLNNNDWYNLKPAGVKRTINKDGKIKIPIGNIIFIGAL
jgi:hypothetical protein